MVSNDMVADDESINIRNNGDNDNGKNIISIPEPQNMKLVNEGHAKLQSAIHELGDRVSTVLQTQETEFLTAYKSHIRNVQKDFLDLKQDIDAKEQAIENNVLVKQFERERDWYKKEALHLDQLLGRVKGREKSLMEKMDELEQDRTWLSNQLKSVMKQKNSLELELNMQENATDVKDDIYKIER